MPFAIRMFIIPKSWSFCSSAQTSQTNATGGFSQCPPSFQLQGPSQALSPMLLKVPQSRLDPPSRGPAPRQRPWPPAWLRGRLCSCFLYCVDTGSPGVVISGLGAESKTKFRKSQFQEEHGPGQILVGFISALFPLLCFQGRIPSTIAHLAQKHRSDPSLSFLLLANYLISFL